MSEKKQTFALAFFAFVAEILFPFKESAIDFNVILFFLTFIA